MITTLTFPGKIAGMNGRGGLIRMHWSTKTKLKNLFLYLVKSQTKNVHSGPVYLKLIRYSSGMPMDYQNLVSTGKIPVDAIVSAKVIIDDNDEIIQKQEYTQVKCKPAEQKTVIIISDYVP